MIIRYEKQAMQAGLWFVIAAVTALLSAFLATLNTKPLIFFGILLGIIFVSSCLAVVIYYCRAILCLAKAKGYSSAIFVSMFLGPLIALFLLTWINWAILVGIVLGPLLPLILAFALKDKSNPIRDQDDLKYPGARCVQCSGRIPATVKLCPHCGWTQPACDVVPAAVPSPTAKPA